MPDREKYIEVLSKTVKTVKEFNEDAPIKISLQCVEDILELLKEQEPVEPFSDDDGGFWCRSCHEDIVWHQKFCSNCGRPVLWEGR